MIKVNRTNVSGLLDAIYGMRHPMNSHHLMDSKIENHEIIIGENDLGLMQRLFKAGTDHRKFMRQIIIHVDITAPLYWWKQFDQYKISVTTNSTSTMHKIMAKEFDASDFSIEKLRGYKVEVSQFIPEIDEFDEIWKEFPLNSNYIVSNKGRMKRLEIISKNGKAFKEILLSPTTTHDGYLKYGVNVKGINKGILAHRCVAMTFKDLTEKDDRVVNHIDGNKFNNHDDNLEVTNQKENCIHSVKNNLTPVSVNTYKGKLDAKQRNEIINRWNEGRISKRGLAKEYNVSHTTINNIINNKYSYASYINEYQEFKTNVLSSLNDLRLEWLISKDKQVWDTLIQELPSSYMQTRMVSMSYENFVNMYNSRKNHKLQEWPELLDQMLPSLTGLKEIAAL